MQRLGEYEHRMRELRRVTETLAAFCHERFHQLDSIVIESKGPSDYVSEVDRCAEDTARDMLAQTFPGEAVVGEEAGGEGAGNYWIIDPLDGTSNFLSGLPFWAVSIAYVEDNTPLLGAVALPEFRTLLTADPDCSLEIYGPLQLHKVGNPLSFGVGRSLRWDEDDRAKFCRQLDGHGYNVVCLGSCAASLAFAALGRLAGFAERNVNLWDCAAGHVICTAAGLSTRIAQARNPQLVDVAASIESSEFGLLDCWTE